MKDDVLENNEAIKNIEKNQFSYLLRSSQLEKFRKMHNMNNSESIRKSIRTELIESNLKLADYVVRNIFIKSIFDTNIEADVLKGYAYEGLIKAVDSFDENNGTTFVTYAFRCIKNNMIRNIKWELGFRHLESYYTDYIKIKKEVENTLGYSLENGVKTIGIIVEKLKEKYNLNEETTSNLLNNLLINVLSLHYNEENNVLVEETCEQSDLILQIDEVLKSLSPKEETILRYRFGVGTDSCKTLDELGQMFGVTRESIRQTEQNALRKIRNSSRIRKIRDYH